MLNWEIRKVVDPMIAIRRAWRAFREVQAARRSAVGSGTIVPYPLDLVSLIARFEEVHVYESVMACGGDLGIAAALLLTPHSTFMGWIRDRKLLEPEDLRATGALAPVGPEDGRRGRVLVVAIGETTLPKDLVDVGERLGVAFWRLSRERDIDRAAWQARARAVVFLSDPERSSAPSVIGGYRLSRCRSDLPFVIQSIGSPDQEPATVLGVADRVVAGDPFVPEVLDPLLALDEHGRAFATATSEQRLATPLRYRPRPEPFDLPGRRLQMRRAVLEAAERAFETQPRVVEALMIDVRTLRRFLREAGLEGGRN